MKLIRKELLDAVFDDMCASVVEQISGMVIDQVNALVCFPGFAQVNVHVDEQIYVQMHE